MLTGHYAAAYMLKRNDRRASLGIYFIAVQFADILWALFMFTGLEQAKLVPGVTTSNDLDLIYVPFSHSLMSSMLWSIAAYVVARLVYKSKRTGILLAFAVFSHYLLDYLVHSPDLPVGFGFTHKLGLGLWNYPLLSMTLELLILSAGFLYYRNRATTSCPLFLALIFATVIPYAIPHPPSMVAIIILMLVVFGFFAFLGFKDKGTLKFSNRHRRVRI